MSNAHQIPREVFRPSLGIGESVELGSCRNPIIVSVQGEFTLCLDNTLASKNCQWSRANTRFTPPLGSGASHIKQPFGVSMVNDYRSVLRDVDEVIGMQAILLIDVDAPVSVPESEDRTRDKTTLGSARQRLRQRNL